MQTRSGTAHDSRTVPDKSRWGVAAILFFGLACLFGIALYGFIILAQPMAHERGWSAAQTGALVSAMWLASPLALFCAPIIERVGARRLFVAGLVILAIAFGSVVLVSSFWQLYLLRLAMGVGKTLCAVSVPVIVTRHFSERFGTAMAIVWSGGAVGGLAFSPLTEFLISHLGWRGTTLVLACLLLVAALTVSLNRDSSPTDRLVAGGSTDVASISAPGGEARENGHIGWKEIVAIDWVVASPMILAVIIQGMGAIILTSQLPVLMVSVGHTPALAATILGLSAAGAVAGNLITGWMLDRYRTFWASLVFGASLFLGLAGFWLVGSNAPLAIIGGLILGSAAGAAEILYIITVKRQFGTRLYAVTYGAWSFSYQLGYALGGGAGGYIYEEAGGNALLLLIGCLYVPAFVVAALLKERRAED
jgi:MFS family permease